MATVGSRWKSARESAGLSVRLAAKVAGIHYNRIYDLEKDDDGVTLRIMKKVADAYGMKLEEVFRDDSGAIGPERLPSEYRPLVEPLAPFDKQTRESIVRNIASNLRFMSLLYSDASVNSQAEGSSLPPSRTTMTEVNTGGDAVREITIPLPRAKGEGAGTRKATRRKGSADTARE